MYSFGFIGTGNMGSAIARAVSESVRPADIILANKPIESAKELAESIGASFGENCEVAGNAKFIFLGVKPQVFDVLADEIKGVLSSRTDRFILVSMAAGISVSSVAEKFGECPIIRIMPNMPVSVGAGTTIYCANDMVTDSELDTFETAMSASGYVGRVDEKLIDAASALSGCGPAFVYMFIEALADGAVQCGLPRDMALTLAAQTVIGSGKTVEVTGLHPGQLKDKVCSPGGTTIEGVLALEKGAFRADVMGAVIAAYKKTLALGK